MRGELRLFERPRGGEWKIVAGPFPVLFGKNGLACGTGISGQNESGLRKKERDGRAPAGIFEIGQGFWIRCTPAARRRLSVSSSHRRRHVER